jgi:hypothetical protein
MTLEEKSSQGYLLFFGKEIRTFNPCPGSDVAEICPPCA